MKQDSRGASYKNREIYDKEEMKVLSQLSEQDKLMFFCDQVQFFKKSFETVFEENCFLKAFVCNLEEKIKKYDSKAVECEQVNYVKADQAYQINQRQSKLLIKQIKELQKEKVDFQAEKNELEKKVLKQAQEISKISNENYILKEELTSLRQNEGNFKKEIESLKLDWAKLKEKHEEDKRMYEKEFFIHFQNKMQSNFSKQQEIRAKQIYELSNQLVNEKNKVKRVVSKLNEVLTLTFNEEDDIERWLEEFKKAAHKYQQEINILVPFQTRGKNSFLQNVVQLQRQKVAASRIQLVKIIEKMEQGK